MDSQIGRLLAALEGSGPTLFALTSDHGEALGEHGLASHGYLFDHNLMVPLVIAAPGVDGTGAGIDRQVRLVDVAPTLLDFAGAAMPDTMDGRSLRRLLSEGRDDTLPTVAVSYASSSNLGLALRSANRSKYTLNNSPWPPIAGVESLYDLRRDPGELSDLRSTAGAADLQPLRELARSLLVERTSNPTIELRNGGDRTFSGVLSGPCVHPLRLTAPDAGSARLDWRQDHAWFSVPPGSSITLHLEAPGDPCLRIEASVAAGPRLEQGVGDPATTAAFGWSWREGRFQPIADPGDLTVGFWWEPGTSWVSGESPTDDDRLREQLEALGYLE
jgi:hypothetical protein